MRALPLFGLSLLFLGVTACSLEQGEDEMSEPNVPHVVMAPIAPAATGTTSTSTGTKTGTSFGFGASTIVTATSN